MIASLEKYLKGLGSVTVAYSGGVDSTFLVAMSAHILGAKKVVAMTMQSLLTPPWEVTFAEELCHTRRIRHLLLDGSFVLLDERIAANPPQRCYYCKRKILEAMREKIPADSPLLAGTNASDVADFRPGIRAEEEMGVRTPLRELGFTKEAIRKYSQAYAIPGFERPSSPCFATRIPYGEPITLDKVRLIERAEQFLRGLGFELVRVRLITGDTAGQRATDQRVTFGFGCIEVADEEVKRALELHKTIARYLLTLGFTRVTLDLEGYQQGKLNKGVTG